jgi:hypothetical protein
LFDPVRRDLVKDDGAELRKNLQRITPNPTSAAMLALEDSRPLLRLDVLRLLLVGGVRACSVPPTIEPKIVMPEVIAPWRRCTVETILLAARQKRRQIPIATFTQT